MTMSVDTMLPRAPELEETSASIDDAMVTNEEYKIWKKNSPFLYDLVITHALEWPTLTAQFLPSPPVHDGVATHELLLGTHTSGQASNYLQVARVQYPLGETDDYQDDGARVKIVQRIPHKGEVNRARYNPHNPSVVATHSVTGLVYVFDRAQHPTDADDFTPDLTLQGQGREGYGLAWSNFEDGHILSASEDTTVCLWDIKAQGTTLDPLCTFRGHTAVVEDVTFDPIVPTRFASVGDDRQLLLWDTRAGETPSERVEAGTGEISAVSWCRYAGGHVLATGGSDKLVRVWDVRSLGQPVHTLEGHTSEVLGLAFSPTEPTILASSGADRRVNVWDLSRIGMEQDAVDAEDGPPELFFQHGGHTAQPTDLGWSPDAPWHLVTAAEDNVLQIWRPNRAITDELDEPTHE